MLVVTVVGALFLSQARLRADAPHLLPAFLAAALLFSFLLYGVHRAQKTLYLVPVILAVCFFLVPGVRSKALVLFSRTEPVVLNLPGAEAIDVAPRDAREREEFSDYEKTVRYVLNSTAPGEKIFVGSVRHDRVCYVDPLIYFLAQRDSATKYHEMHRGLVVTESAQKEIIGELRRNNVRVVVLRQGLDDRCGEPNESSRPAGSKILDEFIHTHYTPDRRFGGNFVLVRGK